MSAFLTQLVIVFVLIFQLFIVPTAVFAQDPVCTDPNKPTSLKCIPVFLGNIANSGTILAGVAAIFFVAFAGLKFLTSGGDPQKVESAKKTLTFAIIGLVIIVSAYFIIKIVSEVTNVDCSVLGVGC
ncbi:hypothetical protein HYS97_00030 [Candidatus Daviesbacteria bacterium]|nr:hypothetical protein [Candidatus Daviesbacteria bacterium]